MHHIRSGLAWLALRTKTNPSIPSFHQSILVATSRACEEWTVRTKDCIQTTAASATSTRWQASRGWKASRTHLTSHQLSQARTTSKSRTRRHSLPWAARSSTRQTRGRSASWHSINKVKTDIVTQWWELFSRTRTCHRLPRLRVKTTLMLERTKILAKLTRSARRGELSQSQLIFLPSTISKMRHFKS